MSGRFDASRLGPCVLPGRVRASTRRVPALALVGGGIFSVQFGSAVATKLFPTVGPGGAVLLRLVTAAIVLMAIWRPRRRPR